MNTPIDPTSPGVDSPEWAQACARLYAIFIPEPAEVAEMNERQRAYLGSLALEQYNDWLDEQNERAGALYDAKGGRW